MDVYEVLIRSMCTYTEHKVRDNLNYVKYNKDLKIFDGIGFFDTYDKAYNWLITNGYKYTKEFYEIYDSPCAFVIRKCVTINDKDECLEDNLDKNDLYFLSRNYYHYVFDENSYLMCLTEHLMYLSHDWDNIFPSWIKYVKTIDDIFIGCDYKHIKIAQKLFTYCDDDIITKKKELELVKKYSKSKNIKDLENLFDYDIKNY